MDTLLSSFSSIVPPTTLDSSVVDGEFELWWAPTFSKVLSHVTIGQTYRFRKREHRRYRKLAWRDALCL